MREMAFGRQIVQEGLVRRRYRIPDMNIAGNTRQIRMALALHVPWSKGYMNQLERFN